MPHTCPSRAIWIGSVTSRQSDSVHVDWSDTWISAMRGIAEPIRTLLAFLLKSTQLTIRGFYNVFSRSKIDSLQPPEVPKTKGKLVTILRRHECLKNHCCRHNFCQNMDISFVEFCACGNNSPHPAVVWCCMRFTVCRLLFSDNDIPSG